MDQTTDAEKAKAVMIWVYGGGLNSGRSSDMIYNGARLADEHGVVVINSNYQVNIFGFQRAPFLPDQNLALLDQRLGVEWVRDKYVGGSSSSFSYTIGG